MHSHHRSQWLALLGSALFSSTALLADQIDGQALLDLLVKKGVLTTQEAANVQHELTPPPSSGTAGNGTNPRVAVEKEKPSPLSFRIGIADFTPVGFMDFTTVYRSTNVGSGIGTNFAGIPFANTSGGRLSETRFSAQNSRIGLRIDSPVNDTKVLGYLESDFLGNAPTNLGVSSNAATLRMRLYFADLKWHDWEFLAGQDWSMLTPNRKGIGVMPSDLFFTSNIDANYQVGLTWARQPQVRAIYHASNELTMGVSLENPDQYAGGANGSPAVTLPTGFNTAQVDTGAATSSPNVMPDIIGKLAYDTKVNGLAWHIDAAGLYRTFKINNFATGATPIDVNTTKSGTGGSVNVSLELIKGFNVIGNAYWSQGGGRYIFGQAPDFAVLPPDASGAYTLSALRADSYLAGAEWQVAPTSTLYGYYSQVNIGSSYAQQANGSYVGYGYPGSPSSHNRSLEEFTLGVTQTIWKNPSYGALQLMSQISYIDRKPWFVAAGAPTNAHTGEFLINLRYLLP
jgi:hypothetical protein